MAKLAVACALLVAVILPTTPSRGASSSVLVTMDVPSATTLDATGCANGTNGVTDLGTVLPGTGAVGGACGLEFGSSNDTSSLRVVQTDMTGSALHAVADQTFDTTLAGDGTATLSLGANLDYARSVAIAPDGDIILAGYSNNGVDTDEAVARLTPAGVPDPGFGGGSGNVTFPAAEGGQFNKVIVQSDGKIVLFGTVIVATVAVPIVRRLLPDGSPDPSWNGTGVIRLTGIDMDYIWAATRMRDGRFAVAGDAWTTVRETRVAMLHANGTLDRSWGAGGLFSSALGGEGIDIAEHGTGALVVGGINKSATTDNEWYIQRVAAGGTLDTGWATGGRWTWQPTLGNDVLYSLHVAPDGDIVAAGHVETGAAAAFGAVRLQADGTPEPTFGDALGTVTHDTTAGDDTSLASLLLPDGKLLVAGSGGDFALHRLTSTGALDPSFGTGGRIVYDFAAGTDQVRGMAFGADGDVLVAGYASSTDFALLALGGSGIPNYATGVTDWDQGTANGMFGMCLHSVAGATAVWTATGSCPQSDGAMWRAVPTTLDTMATVASGVTTATVDVRFGTLAGTAQPRGRYMAPVTFEVVAP